MDGVEVLSSYLFSMIPANAVSYSLLDKSDSSLELRGKSGVYRWVNRYNGKSYVGSSINLINRLKKYYNKNHLIKENMLIYKAL
jgi:hypothetical protein